MSDLASAVSFFHAEGVLATDLLEVSHDLRDLERPGFWAVVGTFEETWTLARFRRVEALPLPQPLGTWNPVPIEAWQSSLDQDQYELAVEKVRADIADGTVYQANICRVLSAPLSTKHDLLALAHRLQMANPAPHSCFLRLPGLEIVCASPELFLRRDGEDLISSPIKGTGAMANDMGSKDAAENVMIVDLVRNDLGAIAITGSVEVPRLLAVEEHPGLFHLVSDVTARIRNGITWAEIFSASFPPGSVSGAPKSSALRIIRELEPSPRGPYCGAIGWIDGDRADLAVGIRTFWQGDDEILRFGTGAGITWGSDPRAEWRETELKADRLIGLAAGCEVALPK
ncbi:MAG TPA: chorismate-binding protein [Candidatus Nanopelagicaceae bacterium]|nr:chorismate-binding protein [Candidatus Nanopelagicaceae bacterium]